MKSAAHQYEDKLLEFAYGELPQHEADAVDAHVRGCNRCAQSLSEIRGVRATMARLPMEAAPDAGLESLLAYAEQAAKRSSTKTAPSMWKRFLAPLASVMALVTVGVIAFRANQEFDTSPASAIADQKIAERSKEQAEKRPDPAPVAVATPPADGLAQQQQQDLAPVAPAPIVAAAAPEAPLQEEERANKLKGKEGKNAALDDLAESGGKRGDVWAPEPKVNAPQSTTRRAVTKSPPMPVANDEQVARRDNFSDVGVRGAGLAKDSAPPPPPPPAKEPAQDKVGYGLSPGGGTQAGGSGTSGGVDTEIAAKTEPMKPVAEKQKAGRKEEEAKKSSAGEQWEQPAAPVAVAPTPSAAPSSSYAPSAPSKKLSKGSLQMPQLRNERTSLGAESDDSAALEKTDTLAANSDAKFSQRQREAARTQSLESARVASSRGDRVSEIRLLAQVLESGATGYERLEALKRICDAYEFLGEHDSADPFCDQVLREFPTSAAAKAVSDRRKNVQRAPKPSPKSAAPSREQRAFDEDSVKPAEAAPTQAY